MPARRSGRTTNSELAAYRHGSFTLLFQREIPETVTLGQQGRHRDRAHEETVIHSTEQTFAPMRRTGAYRASSAAALISWLGHLHGLARQLGVASVADALEHNVGLVIADPVSSQAAPADIARVKRAAARFGFHGAVA